MRTPPHVLASCFAEQITKYIALMRSLGRMFTIEEGHLRSFDTFCLAKQYRGPLTQQLALEYAYAVPDVSATQYAKRYRILRAFAVYLANFDPEVKPFDPHAVPVTPHRCLAYIYTDAEITLLLRTVRRMTLRHPFRVLMYQTLIGLIASSGLRIREALRLDLADVDLRRCTLQIRCTKFRKSRIVVIHPTTRDRLARYIRLRAAHGAPPGETALFLGMRLKRVCYPTVNNFFKSLRRKAGIRPATGREPRIHDLRHTFAVRRVLAWYEAGEDVQAKLPLLATYLGHAHFQDTAYYLTAGSELLAKASERFAQNRSHAHD